MMGEYFNVGISHFPTETASSLGMDGHADTIKYRPQTVDLGNEPTALNGYGPNTDLTPFLDFPPKNGIVDGSNA